MRCGQEGLGSEIPAEKGDGMNWQSHWQGVTDKVALEEIQLWGNADKILTGAPKQQEQWSLYSGWVQR